MMCLKERCNYLTGTLGSARHFLALELCTHIFATYSQQRTWSFRCTDRQNTITSVFRIISWFSCILIDFMAQWNSRIYPIDILLATNRGVGKLLLIWRQLHKQICHLMQRLCEPTSKFTIQKVFRQQLSSGMQDTQMNMILPSPIDTACLSRRDRSERVGADTASRLS